MSKQTLHYLVPSHSLKGGIQEFAKGIMRVAESNYDIRLDDTTSIFEQPFLKKIAYFNGGLFHLFFYKIYRWVLARQYFKNEDIVHYWQIRSATTHPNKRSLITVHGMEIIRDEIPEHIYPIYQDAFNRARFITADSRYTKDLLTKNFKIDESKLHLIFPCIELKQFTGIARKKQKILTFGTLCRHVARKNVLRIVEALEVYYQKYNKDFEYLLAGTGDETKQILEKLEKVSFKWKYLGEISDEEKRKDFYPKLDVFMMLPLALKNSVEGFGIVYLEANAYGVPVLAANNGGIPDAVKPGISGEFANPEKSTDIAKKLDYLVGKKDSYEESAKEWVKQFDVKVIGGQFMELYSQL